MTRSPSPVKTDIDVQPLDTLNEEDCSPPPRKIPTTPARDTPSRRRRSIRSTTRSPSPVAAVKQEVPRVLDVLVEEEPAEPEEAKPVSAMEVGDVESTKLDETPTAEADAEIVSEELVEDVEEEAKLESEAIKTEPSTDDLSTSVGNGEANTEDAAASESAPKTPVKDAAVKDSKDSKADTSEPSTPDDKTKRAEVPLKKPPRSTEPRVIEFTNVEAEPELPESGIYLSWMDSDLSLNLDQSKGFLCGRPINQPHMLTTFGGVRATHGVRTGRVAYEVHLNTITYSKHYDPPKYDIRVGWSTRATNLQLGEGPLSFGYNMQRKKQLNGVFTDYGMLLRTGDVVGVYLDLESEPCRIEYTVNGKKQGVAFEFERSELGDAALYPHVLTKCVSYQCNFSDAENLLVNTKEPEYSEPDEKNERIQIVSSEYAKIM